MLWKRVGVWGGGFLGFGGVSLGGQGSEGGSYPPGGGGGRVIPRGFRPFLGFWTHFWGFLTFFGVFGGFGGPGPVPGGVDPPGGGGGYPPPLGGSKNGTPPFLPTLFGQNPRI